MNRVDGVTWRYVARVRARGPQNNLPRWSRSYEMVKVKDSKVLLPVVEPRAEASQMWLFQFPRYILPRCYRSPMKFFTIWMRPIVYHRSSDKDPYLPVLEVYFEEDKPTRRPIGVQGTKFLLRSGFNWNLPRLSSRLSLDLFRTQLFESSYYTKQ